MDGGLNAYRRTPREMPCGELSAEFRTFLPRLSGNFSAAPLGAVDHQVFRCRNAVLKFIEKSEQN
jgi:hypothetical protein